MKLSSSINLIGAKILLVDDDDFILEALEVGLSHINCDISTALSGATALHILEQKPIDIIISDMTMPEMSGQELLRKVSELYPDTIRMMLTANTDLHLIMDAINSGHIWGYMEKPWDLNILIRTLDQALATRKALAERNLLQQTLKYYQHYQKKKFEGFVGESVPMQFVYKSIECAAPSNAAVFITGPSGTGKEVAAAAIHNLSKRRDKPFIAINCAAIPTELMESEIFGHVKGAFSGAVSNREGAASQANGGTLFFDEIGEMDMALQAKLLRFIQTGSFQKIGSDKLETVSVRFICATNRDPKVAIQEKKLREDLFYRLNVVSIRLPALSERGGDAVLLAQYFLNKYSTAENRIFVGLASEAESLIASYAWPGNVRQLQNAIHSCVVMSEGPLLTYSALAAALGMPATTVLSSVSQVSQVPALLHPSIHLPESVADIASLAAVERLAIESAVRICNDNVVEAASALGVSPSTLYRKIQLWQQA